MHADTLEVQDTAVLAPVTAAFPKVKHDSCLRHTSSPSLWLEPTTNEDEELQTQDVARDQSGMQAISICPFAS